MYRLCLFFFLTKTCAFTFGIFIALKKKRVSRYDSKIVELDEIKDFWPDGRWGWCVPGQDIRPVLFVFIIRYSTYVFSRVFTHMEKNVSVSFICNSDLYAL